MDFARKLLPHEKLWFAVLDQACADAGSRNRKIREDAEAWWASDMPDFFSWLTEIPRSQLDKLRASRGGLRPANGRKIGAQVGLRIRPGNQDYDYERAAAKYRPGRAA